MKGIILLVLACATSCVTAAPSKPNILFILTEDQGAHLGFLGTPGLQTPNMDALARSGMYFKNAFVAYPVCSASKAAILTALPNHLNGLLNNTLNYHQPADTLTPQQRKNPLYVSNRVNARYPTLIERLKAAGYYQGVTHKLHLAPNEKFPYDEFIDGVSKDLVGGFLKRAAATGRPWHLFYNVGVSHRPFPNSDKVKIRVKPGEVKLPAYLPDTPLVRQDWAEYLAAIEKADALIGGVIVALRESGDYKNTVIICMGGDHGPAFPHGKMTLYDLGLRVTLSINGLGVNAKVSEALVSGLDLAPTILDLVGEAPLQQSFGISLKPILGDNESGNRREYVMAEISNKGVLPNNGMQERAVFDSRWKLIRRSKMDSLWRQVQADSREMKPWRNRSYAEIVRVKDQFPESFRVLAEMYPQELGGKPPEVELYDLESDPDEMNNLAGDPLYAVKLAHLTKVLRKWSEKADDTSMVWEIQR